MLKRLRFYILSVLLISLVGVSLSEDNYFFAKTLTLNHNDTASLQRGAKLYFNYCSGCHSLRYERYNEVAKIIGINNPDEILYQQVIKKSLAFNLNADIHEYVQTAMTDNDAQKWFGVVPPDLTNITLIRSPTWVYNFLRSFYQDPSRPTGTNNLIAINTNMPNVLLPLRGETLVVSNKYNQFDHFVTTKAGKMKPLEFDAAMYDLVNFLNFVADPNKIIRIWIGIACIALLGILFMLCYFWQCTLRKKV